MLGLKCTSCQALLELDDAFAGGVCRCIHCGTIQTVPNQPRAGAPKREATQSRPEPVAVAVEPPPVEHIPGMQTPDATLWKIVYGLAAAIVLGVGIVIWLALSGPSKTTTASTDHVAPPTPDSSSTATPEPEAPSPQPAPAPPVVPAAVVPSPAPIPKPAPAPVSGASFCGVALNAHSLIYVVDRTSMTPGLFEPTKRALIKSLRSLRPDQRFQIIFWANKSEPQGAAIPQAGLTEASTSAVTQAITNIAAVEVTGDTTMKAGVEKAVDKKPELILYVTGKTTHELEIADRVLALRGNSPVRIDAILLGGSHSEPAMKRIAEKSGGEYRFVTPEELDHFGQ